LNQTRLLRRACGFYALLTVAALAWVRLRTGGWMPTSFLAGDVIASLAWGLATAVVVLILSSVLMRSNRAFQWLARELHGVLGKVDITTAASLAISSAIGEELFFRAAMQPVLGYGLTSVLFGLLHVGPNRRYLVWTVSAIAVGFALGGILLATGNVLGAILAHGLINFINLLRIGRRHTHDTGAQAA